MENQTTNQTHPAKKEIYDLKKNQKELELMAQFRRKKIKKTLLIVLPLLVLAGLLTFAIVKSAKNSGSSPPDNSGGTPKMEISPLEFDAGNISMAAGLFKKDFEIKNTGTGDLKISSISTSCHCTTALLRINGKESNKFGMDGSPAYWSGIIPTGQTGQLEVIFDPAFHGPQGTGPATREIYFTTNDPQNKEAKVTLNANVTP